MLALVSFFCGYQGNHYCCKRYHPRVTNPPPLIFFFASSSFLANPINITSSKHLYLVSSPIPRLILPLLAFLFFLGFPISTSPSPFTLHEPPFSLSLSSFHQSPLRLKNPPNPPPPSPKKQLTSISIQTLIGEDCIRISWPVDSARPFPMDPPYDGFPPYPTIPEGSPTTPLFPEMDIDFTGFTPDR